MKGMPTGKRVSSPAHRVRWARQHNTKLSKTDVARAIGLIAVRYSQLEAGQAPINSVPVPILAKLAQTLHTSVDWLKYGTERSRFFAVKGMGTMEIPETISVSEPVPPPPLATVTPVEPQPVEPIPLPPSEP